METQDFKNVIETLEMATLDYGMELKYRHIEPAIVACQMQIPMEPEITNKSYIIYNCNRCGVELPFNSYCYNCGQKIDWTTSMGDELL